MTELLPIAPIDYLIIGHLTQDLTPSGPMLGGTASYASLTARALGLRSADTVRCPTYPSRLPVVQLDHVYARGLEPVHLQVPRGRIWGQMSDHLPLIAEFRF